LRRTAPPNLILLDLRMPVMNGWDFRKRQAQDPTLQSGGQDASARPGDNSHATDPPPPPSQLGRRHGCTPNHGGPPLMRSSLSPVR
jgi:CheY-like chemotaxis protein